MVRLSVLSCLLACLPLASHASAENLSVNAVWLNYDSLPTSSDLLFVITNPPIVSSGAINIDRWLPTPVIEWQHFDIGLNPGVVFIMSPSSGSVINRVIGDSQDIFGSLVLSSTTDLLTLSESQITVLNNAGINVSSVPEADAYMLMLAGLGVMPLRRRTQHTAQY